MYLPILCNFHPRAKSTKREYSCKKQFTWSVIFYIPFPIISAICAWIRSLYPPSPVSLYPAVNLTITFFWYLSFSLSKWSRYHKIGKRSLWPGAAEGELRLEQHRSPSCLLSKISKENTWKWGYEFPVLQPPNFPSGMCLNPQAGHQLQIRGLWGQCQFFQQEYFLINSVLIS